MSRELYVSSTTSASLRDYTEQPLKAGQVRIKAEHGAAKHGTELAFLKGYGGARGGFDREMQVFTGGSGKANPSPIVPGNMVVGRVVELGADVTSFKIGDRVLTYGGFRETAVADARQGVHGDGVVMVPMPETLDWRSAVCIDPAAFALAAVRDGNVRVGDAAAIFSLGAIGLIGVQWARLAGASPIIAVDPLESRRKLALTLGADICLDPLACDAGLEIKKATKKRGVDVAVEYSGSAAALQSALKSVAFGGTVVCGAFPPPYGAGLDFGAESHMNRPRIVFSRACSDPNADHPRWDQARIWETCWNAICAGKIRGEQIVEPVVPFGEAPAAYIRMVADPASSIKLGVKF